MFQYQEFSMRKKNIFIHYWKRILAAEMVLFVSFSEKEIETSSGTKTPNHSLYCIQFQKSQDSSPQLG